MANSGDSAQARQATLMSEAEVAAATGDSISVRRLQQLRQRGGGPPYLKIGRRVLYEWPDIEDWLRRRKRSSTSDSGAE